MASKIMAVISYPALRETLHNNGALEVAKFSWKESARKCLNVYNRLLTA